MWVYTKSEHIKYASHELISEAQLFEELHVCPLLFSTVTRLQEGFRGEQMEIFQNWGVALKCLKSVLELLLFFLFFYLIK